MRRIVSFVPVVLIASAAAASAQVLRAAELNTDQIRALDRAKTAIVIPAGILEAHGPYLPSFTDGYANERMARDIAEAVAARPGWVALMFPTIPLGAEGADETGGHRGFGGTFSVRPSTLRSVFMDLADSIGERKFRWVFLVHGHNSLSHNRVLGDVESYFFETYGGTFVHVTDLAASEIWARTEDKSRRPAFDAEAAGPHAGASETSHMLFLVPHLVRPDYINASPVRGGNDMEHLSTLAVDPNWTGYMGSPHLGTAADGAEQSRRLAVYSRELVTKVLDGTLDPRTVPHLTDFLWKGPAAKSPAYQRLMKAFYDHEREQGERQQKWLAARGQK